MERIFEIIALVLLSAASMLGAQEKVRYSIAPGKSSMEVHVYKDGVFKAFGHDHLITTKNVSGTVRFDALKIQNSEAHLKVDANSLTVIDPGESQQDRQNVQTTMTSDKVLDVARFPEIVFTSTGVSLATKTPTGWEVMLSGNLKLHGVEKPVNLLLHVHADGRDLQAQGEVSLLQTEFGITPIKVGGGAVKVKDKVRISFTVLATTTNP